MEQMYKQTLITKRGIYEENKNIYKGYVGQQYFEEVGGKENSITNTVQS